MAQENMGGEEATLDTNSLINKYPFFHSSCTLLYCMVNIYLCLVLYVKHLFLFMCLVLYVEHLFLFMCLVLYGLIIEHHLVIQVVTYSVLAADVSQL